MLLVRLASLPAQHTNNGVTSITKMFSIEIFFNDSYHFFVTFNSHNLIPTFISITLNSFNLLNWYIKSMIGQGLNLKKGFMFFHIVSGVLAACAVLIFLLSGKYSWGYKLFLGCYIFSGVTILAFFFKTLSRLQHLYFEIIFSVPLLIAAFMFLTWLFEYYFFGK